MKNRSYFANTVESALSLARRELGDDTLLLTTGRTSASDRHLAPTRLWLGSMTNALIVPLRRRIGAVCHRLARELADVRGELTRLSISLGNPLKPAPLKCLANNLNTGSSAWKTAACLAI